MHPTTFLTTLGMRTTASFSSFSPNKTLYQKKSSSAFQNIKNGSIAGISPVPDKKYKSVKERLDDLGADLKNASSSSQVNIVAKNKRKAAKVAPLPESMKKRQKIKLQEKFSPLI